MSNTTKFIVEVTDNGSAGRTTKEVKNLTASLGDAASAAGRTSKALESAKLATSSTKGKGGESVAYAQARGNIGTGAEARDFAKQSEGLGGLVRLYATYAANIYAAGAAFRALSDAANTTNIVQGLNQLGAASGVALGALSKQFANASGGAISFREAMQSTAQATSAGLSSKQFLQLGDVAKKASQALGINMSDAVSRLTRGIVKLEPELLDELGLFTKIGPATENYAKSIGKSASALTDFERRQAFANAVLKEGADKFSDINIPTNPYDKLAASLKNLSFEILDVVNKSLGPLINVLSQSPTALLAVVAAIGGIMLKQALPALGQYRAGLADSATEFEKFAKSRAASAAAALAIVKDNNKKEVLAEQEKIAEIKQARVEEYQANLRDLAKGTTTKGTQRKLQSILDPARTVSDISQTEIKWLEARSRGNTVLAATYKQVADAILAAQRAEQAYIDAGKKLDIKNAQAPGARTAAGIAITQAEAARQRSASRSIVSQASETTAVEGLRTAFPKLIESIKTEKLTGLRGALTGVAGAASIVTTKVTGLISVFSSVFAYIGIIVTAYQLLSSALSRNSEEVGKYNDALKAQEDNVANIVAVGKKYQDTLSIDSILARSTAFTNLADAVAASADALEKAEAKAGWFDNLTNSVSKFWGGDLKTKFAEGTSKAVVEGLKEINSTEIRQQAEASFKALLNVKELTESSIEEAVKKGIDPKAIAGLFDKIKIDDAKLSAPLRGLQDGFKNLNKSFQDLSNSLVNNDPLSKFGVDLVTQSSALKDAFKDPINAAGALNSILKDTSQIKAFPAETQNSILAAANSYKTITADISKYNAQIEQANKLIEASKTLGGPGASKESVQQAITLKLQGEALLQSATEALKASTDKQKSINTNLTSGLNAAMVRGFQLIEAPLTRAYAQASIDTQKVLLGFLPKTPESVMLSARLEVQSIELKKIEITTQRELINEIRLNTLAQRESELLKADINSKDSKKAKEVLTELNDIRQQRKLIKKPGSVTEELGAGAADVASQQAGYKTQMLMLSTQQQNALVTGTINAVSAAFGVAIKANDDAVKKLQEDNKEYFESSQFRALALPQQAAEKASRAAAEAEQVGVGTRLKAAEGVAVARRVGAASAPGSEIRGLAAAAETEAKKQYKLNEDRLTQESSIAKTVSDRNVSELTITDSVKQQVQELQKSNAISNIIAQQDQEALNFDNQKLDYQKSIGQISEDQYQNQKRINDLKIADVEYTNKILQLTIAYKKQQTEIGAQLADPANTSRTAELAAEAQTNAAIFTAETAAAKQGIELKKESISLLSSMDERTRTYAEAFKGTVDSMSDALVDFAMTGKASFGDLIQSMITDLIKFEQRQMMRAAYQGMGGSGGVLGALGSIGASLFGSSTATASELANFGGYGSDNSGFGAIEPGGYSGPVYPNALGGVFDQGRTNFAKGGAFTNTIVTRPTTFAFAKGAGLMGESGPEAIMPLKRGPNGSLGVQGGNGGSVDVVVNNYGTEKAKTKETTDARGNRRIEVIIGEMTAGEMSRPNSPIQTSMRGTFGIAPQLTRR